jgi:hypothetical protein
MAIVGFLKVPETHVLQQLYCFVLNASEAKDLEFITHKLPMRRPAKDFRLAIKESSLGCSRECSRDDIR